MDSLSFYYTTLLQQFLHQTEQLVRHIPKWQVYPSGRYNHRTTMREGIIAQSPVITTQTRITYAAKRQILVGNVHYGIIHAAASRRGVAQDMFCALLTSEIV